MLVWGVLAQCEYCKRRNWMLKRCDALNLVPASESPIENLGIDFIGSLQVPGDKTFSLVPWHLYYCTRFDQFGKGRRMPWPEHRKLRSAPSRALTTSWRTTWPVSHRGGEGGDCFGRKRIRHIRTIVGHLQWNGLVKRVALTVTEGLGSLVAEGDSSFQNLLQRTYKEELKEYALRITSYLLGRTAQRSF